MAFSHGLCHFFRFRTSGWNKTDKAQICRRAPFFLKHTVQISSSNQVKVTFLPEGVSVLAYPGEPLYKVAERGLLLL